MCMQAVVHPVVPRRRRPWDAPARRLARADERLFGQLVGRRSAVADYALAELSRAANGAGLWLGIAAGLSALGGHRERRAAARGVVAIGLASAVANGPLKHTWRRRRPTVALQLPPRGLLATPRSHSFPSGHAASASAFATAASAELPRVAALPLSALALAVAYSRVHTGVHYPGDVLGGAVVGVAAGLVSGRVLDAIEAELGAVPPHAERPIPRRAVLVTSPHAGRAQRLAEARRAMAQVARSLGIPVDPVHAARLLAAGKVATIDAGRLVAPGRPPRHFAHAATAGLSVSFAKLATRASMRHRFGRLTYAIAATVALRQQEPFRCALHYDSRVDRLELVHLAIINAPVFGGFLGMRIPGSDLRDHALDLIAVERLPMRRVVLAALHPILGLRRSIRGVRVLRLPLVRVHTDRELEVALDGEVLGRIPADFEAAGDALRVVTPREFRRTSPAAASIP
jgi:diacylglycerol kinase family enzyme/membrane-associated phospholipid phosphatase